MAKTSPTIRSALSSLGRGGSAAAGGKTAAATLRAERDDLIGRCGRLKTKLAAAQSAADLAARRVRDILQAREIDDLALAKAERARNEAFGSAHGMEDALADLTTRLAATEAAIEAERLRLERETALAGRVAAIDELKAAGDGLDAATVALSECYERFRRAAWSAMPEATDRPFGASTFIGEIRVHLLHAAFPDDFGKPGHSYAANLAAAIAATVRELRTEADARASNLVDLPLVPRFVPAPTFPEVQIALIREAFYRDALGTPISLPIGGIMMPEPIAAEAVRQGVGFGAATDEGRQIIAITFRNPHARIERLADGRFAPVAFRGVISESGKGTPPAPPPADLGMLPGSVELAEAAQ